MQKILITGATSGIGRATALRFQGKCSHITICGRRGTRLVELKQQIESNSTTIVHIAEFDVQDFNACQQAISLIPEPFKPIDLLINNAGLALGLDPIHEGSLEHWNTMIDTNVKGILHMTKLISPGMVERKHGHIINVSSSSGKYAYPRGNVYCATKRAVNALTETMRLDLHLHGIRVSQVSPGHVEETEFAITRFEGNAKKAAIYDEFQPLRSADVAETIFFIANQPAHVNIQDVEMWGSQQASATVIDKSGR